MAAVDTISRPQLTRNKTEAQPNRQNRQTIQVRIPLARMNSAPPNLPALQRQKSVKITELPDSSPRSLENYFRKHIDRNYHQLLSDNSKKCIGYSSLIKDYLSEQLSQSPVSPINNAQFVETIGNIQKKYINNIKNYKYDDSTIKRKSIDEYKKEFPDGLEGTHDITAKSWLADKSLIKKSKKDIKYIYMKSFHDGSTTTTLINNTSNYFRFRLWEDDDNDDMVLLTKDVNDKFYHYVMRMMEYHANLILSLYHGTERAQLMTMDVWGNETSQIIINFTIDETCIEGNGIRLLPKIKGTKLTGKHVNGGVSTPMGFSYIYRTEEFNKVTTHELLHQFNIRCCSHGQGNYKEIIKDLVNLHNNGTEYLLDETYIELLGNILHLTMLPVDVLGIDASAHHTISFLEIERYWSLWQAAKILNHFGFNGFAEFVNPKLCRQILTKSTRCNSGIKLQESTNVMSYYINRAAIYCDFDRFLEEFKEEISTTNILQSGESSKEFGVKFTNYVLAYYTDSRISKNFANIINILMKVAKTHEDKIYNSNEFSIYNTMRMSATERNFSQLRDIKGLVDSVNQDDEKEVSSGGRKIKKKSAKNTRKHKGIVQSGGNKGRLKKGYKYSGKKLKSGLPQIVKCKSKNK